jgi:hypothetical protein
MLMNIALLPINDDYACCIYKKQLLIKQFLKNRKKIPYLDIDYVLSLNDNYSKFRNYKRVNKSNSFI